MTILFDSSRLDYPVSFGRGILATSPSFYCDRTSSDEAWAAQVFGDLHCDAPGVYEDEAPELPDSAYFDPETDFEPLVDHPHDAFIGGLDR